MEDSSRRRRLLLMTLGLVLALIAGGATLYLAGQRPAPTVEVPMERVVVAIQNIPARGELTIENIAVREIPESAVLADAVRDVSQVEGEITAVPISVGQQITANLLVGTHGDPIPIIPEGDEIGEDTPAWRAFSISVPRNRAVGGLLQDGDRVDLIVSVDLNIQTLLVPTEDEEGNIVLVQEDASSIPFISPETGEIEGIRPGMSTKVTLTDLSILRADSESGLYVVRVDLAQAEFLTQLMRDPDVGAASGDPFTFALRSQADTREIDTDEFGTTLDRVIEFFRFRVPFLLDLDVLLGFDVDPIVQGPAPSPPEPVTPTPEPVTPTPEPEPEPDE